METERFELTSEDLDKCYKEWTRKDNLTLFQLVARKTASKILSLFEPVELEALGDEELDQIALTDDDVAELEQTASIGLPPRDHIQYKQSFAWLCNSRLKEKVTQAALRKNQKGQLYRVKE